MKLNQQNVLTIVNENRVKFEPFGNLVEESLMHFTSHSRSIDSFAEQENDDLQENVVIDDIEDEVEDEIIDFQVDSKASSVTNNISLSNEEINLLISQLNQKQREIFNVINRWARQTVQNRSSDTPVKIPPLRLFITDNAGTGKSFLIKTLYSSVSKTLNFRTSSVEKPKVLLLAPTGVAAINISGTTIHSGLGIPVECRGMHVPKLSDKKRCELRIKYEELKMIIIDEISMVSNKLMLYIHQRLVDIFGYSENSSVPFAGITMIFVGDLFQLPPVLQKPIYADYYDEIFNIHHLWRTFKFCELSQVMRQREDSSFIDLLNNVRIGELSDNDVDVFSSRVIDKTDENYPVDALHIFAENEPCLLYTSPSPRDKRQSRMTSSA